MNEEIKVTMGLDVGPIALGLRKAESLLDSFEKSALGAKATNLFEEIFPIASMTGAILTLEKAISKARDLKRASDEFGVSTGFMQDINNIGALAGISEQKIEKMMGAFIKTLPVGSDVEAKFYEVADSISKIQDPVSRAQAAFESFNKAGFRMLPILEKGSAGIKELGAAFSKFSEQEIEDLENAEVALKQFENFFIVWMGRLLNAYQFFVKTIKEGSTGDNSWTRFIPGGLNLPVAAIIGKIKDIKDAEIRESNRAQEAIIQKAAMAAAASKVEAEKVAAAWKKVQQVQEDIRFKNANPEEQLKMLRTGQEYLQHQYELETSEEKRVEITAEILKLEEKIQEIQKKQADENSKAIDKRFEKINSASDKWLDSKRRLEQTQHPEFTLEDLAKSHGGHWDNTITNRPQWIAGQGGIDARRVEQLREWAKQNAMSDNPQDQALAKDQWNQADKIFDDLKKRFPFLKDPQEELKEAAKKSESHLDELLQLGKGDGINTNPANG